MSVILGGLYVYSDVTTRIAWREAEAEAARDMPRWRLAEMEEDRRQVPDAENSALRIAAISFPKEYIRFIDVPNYENIFSKLSSNVELNAQQVALIQDTKVRIEKPLEEARKLKDMPYGRFPITYSVDYFGTQPREYANSYLLGDWLVHDAFLRVQERSADGAIDSCRALVNTGRARGDEPTLLSFLVRARMHFLTFSRLERVLGQGEPSEAALRELQTLLEMEITQYNLPFTLRAERAGHQHLVDSIRAGKASVLTLDMRVIRISREQTFREWVDEQLPGTLLKFYPELLQNLNRAIEIATLPRHERTAKLMELDEKVQSSKNPIKAIWPSTSKWHLVDCRSQAYLGAAVAGLGCERYRSKRGKWPPSLDALVKEGLLARVPVDPMDGQPLRYRRNNKGIVIYAIGTDLKDDDGNVVSDAFSEMFALEKTSRLNLPWPADLGIRMWNLELRRLPPRPSAVIVDVPNRAPDSGRSP